MAPDLSRTRKRLPWILGSVVLLLVVLVLVGPRLIPVDALVARALQQVEEQSGYRVTVDDASLAFTWKGLALRLSGVEAAAPDTSLTASAGTVDLLLAFGPLLRKEAEIRSYAVRDAAMTTRRESATTELTDLRLDGAVHLGATDSRFDGRGRTGVTVTTAQGTFPLPETGFEFQGRPHMEETPRRIALERVAVESGPLTVRLAGGSMDENGTWVTRLQGDADPVTLDELLALLPEDLAAQARERSARGTLTVGAIDFDSSREAQPMVVGARIEEFSVTAPQGPSVAGTIRIDAKAEGDVVVDADLGTGDAPFRAGLTWHRERDPRITLRAAAMALAPFLVGTSAPTLEGGAVTADLTVTGTEPIAPVGIPELTGTVSWQGIHGTWRGKPLHRADADIEFAGRSVRIPKFEAVIGGSDLSLSGTIADLGDPLLRFQARSDRLNLDELQAPAEGMPAEAAAPSEEGPLLVMPMDGSYRADALVVRGLTLEALRADAHLDAEGATMKGEAGLMGGRVNANLTAAPEEGGRWKWHVDLEAGGVSLGPVMRILWAYAPEIDGLTKATATLDGIYDPEATDPLANLSLDSVVRISDGAVRNAPRLQQLGLNLGVPGVSTERWPFRDWVSHVRMKDGRVLLDSLEVNQLGVTWRGAASVGVDHTLDASGVARLDPSVVKLPAALAAVASFLKDPDGRIPVDFVARGPVKDPEVGLDLDALTARARERMSAEEKKKLEDALDKLVKDDDLKSRLKKLTGGN